jgi:hypothetical protein
MIQCQYPFEEYEGYIFFHKKEGRKYILLKKGKLKKCTSYARYLYQVYHKCKLSKNEHIDHIDNNKLNDNIDNLQILSPAENNKKASKPKKMVKIECLNCSSVFTREVKNTFLSKKGKFTCCSRKCTGIIRRKLQLGEINPDVVCKVLDFFILTII